MKTSAEFFKFNLKRLRKIARFKQKDIAPLAGFESIRGYQKYEQGESAPTPEILDRLAKVLGCTAWELLQPPANHEIYDKHIRDNYQPDNQRNAKAIPDAFSSPKVIYKGENKTDEHQAKDHNLASEIASKVITELRSEALSPIPPEIRIAWKGSPPEIKALCYYMFLERYEFVDALPDKKKAKVLAAVRALGLNLPKGSS